MHYRYIFLVTGLFLSIPLYGNQSPESNHTDKCAVLHISMWRILKGHTQEEHHYDEIGNYVSTESISFEAASFEMNDYKDWVKQRQQERPASSCSGQDPDYENCVKKMNASSEEYSKKNYAEWLSISNRIYEVALAVAKGRGAAMLLNDAEPIYIKPECDITDEVIETINENIWSEKGKRLKNMSSLI